MNPVKRSRQLALAAALGGSSLAACGANTAPTPLPAPSVQPSTALVIPFQTAGLVEALRGAGASPGAVTGLALDSYPSVDVPGVVVRLGEEGIPCFE